MAVALDKRYKKLKFLRTQYEKQYGQHCQMHSEPSAIENIEQDVQQKKKTVRQDHLCRRDENFLKTLLLGDSESQSSAAVHSAESELMRYCEEAPIPKTEDPLK